MGDTPFCMMDIMSSSGCMETTCPQCTSDESSDKRLRRLDSDSNDNFNLEEMCLYQPYLQSMESCCPACATQIETTSTCLKGACEDVDTPPCMMEVAVAGPCVESNCPQCAPDDDSTDTESDDGNMCQYLPFLPAMQSCCAPCATLIGAAELCMQSSCPDESIGEKTDGDASTDGDDPDSGSVIMSTIVSFMSLSGSTLLLF